MLQDRTAAILDLFREMRAAASNPAQRLLADRLAVEVITTDIEPIKMADSLQHWLGLSPGAIAERAA